MARAECRTNCLEKNEGDDVEKSLELLDKVLLEFEDPESLPHLELESPLQGNQSEDDGYMSMNGRRTKIPPDSSNDYSRRNNIKEHQEKQNQEQNEQNEQEQIQNGKQNSFQTISESALPSSSSANELKSHATYCSTSPFSVDVPVMKTENKSLSLSSPLSSTPADTVSNLAQSNSPKLTNFNLKSNIISNDISNRKYIQKNLQKQFSLEDILNINRNNQNCFHKKQMSSEDFTKNQAVNENHCNKIISNSSNFIKSTESEGQTNPLQTTLPKTRPSAIVPSKYSSLPCNGPTRGYVLKNINAGGSYDSSGYNVLGIDINAVHDAVLRGGVAPLPEPIVNEHPVTIYPGRNSPPRNKVPPRTLPGSIERHREVCRNLNTSKNLTLISSNCEDENNHSQNNEIDYGQSLLPLDHITFTKSPLASGFRQHKDDFINYDCEETQPQQHSELQFQKQFFVNNKNDNNSESNHQLVYNKNFLSNLLIPSLKVNCLKNENSVEEQVQKQRSKYNKNNPKLNNENNSDSEEFSDDSLEGQSLPPPPPPPIVPPPPSLSAPVTPSKRGSIAWEINLDSHLTTPPLHHQKPHPESHMTENKKRKSSINKNEKLSPHTDNLLKETKIFTRHRHHSVSGSQSSLISSPDNSIESISNKHSSPYHKNNLRNRANSVEWPEPPDLLICSTEDEAASLYSDTEEAIPVCPNMTGQGTYVIRKGRKERQRLPELNSSPPNFKINAESNSTNHNSLLTPNSRHSIDLGSSIYSVGVQQNSILSPRSRLSLDLSSPNSTSELTSQITFATSSNIVEENKEEIFNNKIKSSNISKQTSNVSPHHSEFKSFLENSFDDLEIKETNVSANDNSGQMIKSVSENNNNNFTNNINIIGNNISNSNSNSSLSGVLNRGASSLTAIGQTSTQNEAIPTSTPRRELAPPIEEDEEQDSESLRSGFPLRQIENNISALLRGDIAVARVGDVNHNARRPLGFRPGVHKSESAKEMLLSQVNAFGPLPPSPPISSPEVEIDRFPPLPPSPQEHICDDEDESDNDILHGMHGIPTNSRIRLKSDILHFNCDEHQQLPPPAVPPHRVTPSSNTLKTRSMDAGYTKKYSSNSSSHINSPGTLPSELPTSNSSRRRLISGAFPKRSIQSPREERRLQTSCSLPETPIFTRGCDIPRTPHRRDSEALTSGGSRTAPRTNATTNNTSLNSSIVGIGSSLGSGRPRSISQALASGEMLRLAGGPARGWYPKQRERNMRPASTEHLDRLHRSQGSMRAWDSCGMQETGGNRKPLTLPPNLTPKFFNKSPREALRRVTSLLIRKGNNKDKEPKKGKEVFIQPSALHYSSALGNEVSTCQTSINISENNEKQQHKKKGFFKNFWKKSKHYSLDQ